MSDFPQGPGWPRQLVRCEHPGCAYWKGHSCEHADKRCERSATPCILPAGHGGEFCGAPPEFKIPIVESLRKAQGSDIPIHLSVGDPVHWISLCGHAEREVEAKFACGKDVVTCEWCKAMILIADTKVKQKLQEAIAEIEHLHALLAKHETDYREMSVQHADALKLVANRDRLLDAANARIKDLEKLMEMR